MCDERGGTEMRVMRINAGQSRRCIVCLDTRGEKREKREAIAGQRVRVCK